MNMPMRMNAKKLVTVIAFVAMVLGTVHVAEWLRHHLLNDLNRVSGGLSET